MVHVQLLTSAFVYNALLPTQNTSLFATSHPRMCLSASSSPPPPTSKQPHVLIFGLGYVGARLARHLVHNDIRVSAITTKPTAAVPAHLKHVFLLDHNDQHNDTQKHSFIQRTLPTVTSIVSTVPPTTRATTLPEGEAAAATEDDVYNSLQSYLSPCSNLRQYACNLKLLIYLSSTSVYGEHDGQVVTEQTVPNPVSTKARRRLHAETQWLNLFRSPDNTNTNTNTDTNTTPSPSAPERQTSPSTLIFRLAGIYGPGRSIVRTINAARFTPHANDHKVTNRIHVDDVVTAISSAVHLVHDDDDDDRVNGRLQSVSVVNISDDEPASRFVTSQYAHRLLSLTYPAATGTRPVVQCGDDLNSKGDGNERSVNRSSKKIGNGLMKRLFFNSIGEQLKYPTYKQGLESIVNDNKI